VSIFGSVLNRAPVDYSSKRVGILPSPWSKSDRARSLGAMEAQSTIYAIIDRIASAISSVGWGLYRPNGDPVEVHPALTVLNKPNPHYTRTEFFETLQQHFELTGEMWQIVVKNGRLPVELWPVRPDKMRPVPSATDFISGYVYGRQPDEVPLGTDEVIYNKRPNPVDPYRGLGPIGTLLMDIQGEVAASEWNTMLFKNGAEPGGIIEVPDTLSDDEFEKLQEHWNDQHKGVRNAHRVAIVEVGQWKDRRFTMRDMQFEQLRRFSRDTFRQAWGFPKPLLGDVEDVNRANAEAGNVVFAQNLLVPRLNRWRTLLNDDFLPMFGSMGRNVRFDYDDPVPPNLMEQGQNERLKALNVKAFTDAGYDPEGALEIFGFPPLEFVGVPSGGSGLPDETGPNVGE